MRKFGHRMPKGRLERQVYTKHRNLGVSLLTVIDGEELHNNHHAYRTSAKLSN